MDKRYSRFFALVAICVITIVYLGIRSVVRASGAWSAVIPGALRLLVAPGYVVHFMVYGVHGGSELSRTIIVEVGSTLFWSFVLLAVSWFFWVRSIDRT